MDVCPSPVRVAHMHACTGRAAEDPGAEGGFNMEIFADSCVASGNRMMMVGPLLEYLGVDNLSDVSDTRALVRQVHPHFILDCVCTCVCVFR